MMFDLPDGVRLEMTCGACPEQYDVYLNDEQVGYLRLRHSWFAAWWAEAGGELVYDVDYAPHTHDDWGLFENEVDRKRLIESAVDALLIRQAASAE